MLKTKKAGLVTKIVVVLLLVYVATALWSLNSRIAQAKAEVATLTDQVQAQTQQNTDLKDAIDNSADSDHRKDIAREKLGLLEPGEKVFHISD